MSGFAADIVENIPIVKEGLEALSTIAENIPLRFLRDVTEFVPIVNGILGIIHRINETAEAAQNNQAHFLRLSARVNSIGNLLNSCIVGVNTKLLLEDFQALLEEIQVFISEYGDKNSLLKIVFGPEFSTRFLYFGRRLSEHATLLNLGLTIDLQTVYNEYQQDLKANFDYISAQNDVTHANIEVLTAQMAEFCEIISNLKKLIEDDKSLEADSTLNAIDMDNLTCNLEINTDLLSLDPAFGSVHRGQFCGFPVAVKTIKKLVNVTQEGYDLAKLALHREALILQSLNNFPGVIQSYGVDSKKVPTLIVTDLAACTLEELLYNVNYRDVLDLTFSSKLSVLIECCSAFVFLIGCGVLHRDIRPSNIMIMADKHVKIGNFGHAKATITGNSTGVTKKGTHSYNCPELLMNTVGKYQYSEATDMYSFAVTMNEVFSGNRPFYMEQTKLIGLMFRNKKERPPLYEGLEPGTAKLQQVIQDGWDTEPDIRPSFRAVRAILIRIREGLSSSSTPLKNSSSAELLRTPESKDTNESPNSQKSTPDNASGFHSINV